MTRELYNTKIIQYNPNTFEVIHYRKPKLRRLGENNTKETNASCRKPNDEELYQQTKRIKRRIRHYMLCNDFDLFWTLTFDSEKVNSYDYSIVKKKIRAWLKAQREKHGKFCYLFIPELHKSGRLHFHGVTGGFRPILTKARNTKTGRLIKKNGKQVYNVDSYQLGFSTVTKIDSSEKVANYITKYITKDLLAIPSGYKQPKYFSSRGLVKPTISYENLERNYFEGLTPSFSAGHLDNLEYKEDIAIYNISINDNGEIIQNTTDTIIKIRKEQGVYEAVD
ncbi:TPA: hypothetical protein U0560_000463 [Streptococcus suis]|uniref:rolling circle replication-associated protein n=1 Tax=Streptococcus suis TaxID=1307 RepID=UPI0015570F10|nr:hypothetical protein [Streptococcus suis]NQK50114.1 hypothetical protein [Streptococcus suis]UUM56574.1 hypothetical protein NQZ93_04570 [Streptococcus suis]HEL2279701.1 hypothetical protein [Streptococcus suis]HEL2281706.1 hypothetical protein [Streptococcus suis]HEL2291636.1 hypothetical protein [Streptococcus suis]